MRYQRVRKPIVITTAVLFHLFLVFHLLFSPVIIIMASNQGIINASFISFALIAVLSLFFGRAYCAWFCPGCGVQELIGPLIKKKAQNTRAVFIKYVIFFMWTMTIAAGYLLKGFARVDLSYGMSGISVERKIVLTLGAIAMIVPLALLFGKFASCKYICWQAPLMIIGRKVRDALKLPGLRVMAAASDCRSCSVCNARCPMNIDVMKHVKSGSGEIIDDECILCGNCIDACRFRALSYRISTPSQNQ